MENDRSSLISLLTLVMAAALFCTGCPKPDDAKKKGDALERKAAVSKTDEAASVKPVKPVEPPPKPTIPEVALTEDNADTCVIKVGGTIPNAALVDLAGRPVELKSLFGKKLTVICFWNGSQTSGLQAIQELQKYIADQYASKGVNVIGINIGDAQPAVSKQVALAEVKYPVLLDPQGEYFSKVATKMLPRVYLLDENGKVLWFDIEYSRSMRRDLQQGIQVVLGEI